MKTKQKKDTTKKERIEECVSKIKALESEFNTDIVYKASRRYYDREYNKYEFVDKEEKENV